MTRPAPEVPGRVFITGAGGFIGRALMARFRELGAQVTGVDLVGNRESGIVAGSTQRPQEWASALSGVELVIHTAAIVSTVAPLDRAWQINVLGTKRVLDAAVSAGARRFVFLSSIAVRGDDFPGGSTQASLQETGRI